MTWPHEDRFRGRVALFAGLSMLAILGAGSVPGVSPRQAALGVLIAGAVSLVAYGYTLTLGRLDARFRSLRPRKFRIACIGGFYLFSVVGCALLVGAPWLVARPARDTPAERMTYYLAVPCLLSAAAASRKSLTFSVPESRRAG
jgi:hypothetical protein